MHGIHYVRVSALSQIVQFANHGWVQKLALLVWGEIEVMMKQSLDTHYNRIRSGHGTETKVFNDLLCKRRLHELILSVPLLLDVYPYVVGGVSLVL